MRLLAMAFAFLSCGAAMAYTSESWNRDVAVLAAAGPQLSGESQIYQSTYDAVVAALPAYPTTTGSVEIIGEAEAKYGAHLKLVRTLLLKRQPNGLIRYNASFWTGENGAIADPLNLFGDLTEVVVRGPIAAVSFDRPIQSVLHKYSIRGPDTDPEVYEVACTVSGSDLDHIERSCTGQSRDIFHNYRLPPLIHEHDMHNEEQSNHFISDDQRLTYLKAAGMFAPVADALDWRENGGPWHSLAVSAALAPPQRAQANAAFAQGFDAYKAGDFDVARSMMRSGLAIDPANPRAWFTLGEIERSAAKNEGDRTKRRMMLISAQTYYAHMAALAPDDPQAMLAKTYAEDAEKHEDD